MVETAALVLTGLGTLWGVFTYFELQRRQTRHEAERREWERQLVVLQERGAAIRDISGMLREIQHCVDEHGGEPGYRNRLDETVRGARAFVLAKSALLGEDVVAIVQSETALSAEVFAERDGDAARRLAETRSNRTRMLDSLGRSRNVVP